MALWLATCASVGRDVLAEWLADHQAHLSHAEGFASGVSRPTEAGEASQTITDLQVELSIRGVVRGGFVAQAAPGSPEDPLPASFPGVVRILVLRRDGMGLLSEVDPHLARVGLRLAGGRAFVAEVRK